MALAYILNTIRVNAQTTWSLATNQDPHKTNSYVFGMLLAGALFMPHIVNWPLNGLQAQIQQKISFILHWPVGRFGYDPSQPAIATGAIAVAGAVAAAGATKVQGAGAVAKRTMTRFRQHQDQ